MRNGKLRGLLITVMLLVFLAGLASILYPYIWGAAVDSSIASIAKDFLEREEPELPATTVIIDSVKPEKGKPYPELWEDMVRYNQNIAAQGQSGLSCAYDYQKASFQLADYGLPDEIFGVLSIPAIDLEMPIYLGATEQHMANGAAHLSQTSLPIGGMDTNCVIAGHRGYSGASYFRYLDKLHVGDARAMVGENDLDGVRRDRRGHMTAAGVDDHVDLCLVRRDGDAADHGRSKAELLQHGFDMPGGFSGTGKIVAGNLILTDERAHFAPVTPC